jgi:hypothetical protein
MITNNNSLSIGTACYEGHLETVREMIEKEPHCIHSKDEVKIRYLYC